MFCGVAIAHRSKHAAPAQPPREDIGARFALPSALMELTSTTGVPKVENAGFVVVNMTSA